MFDTLSFRFYLILVLEACPWLYRISVTAGYAGHARWLIIPVCAWQMVQSLWKKIGRALPVWALFMLLTGFHPVFAQSAEITFPTQVQSGNIFMQGEQVKIKIRVQAGDTIIWVVTNFKGKKVDSGRIRVKDHQVKIVPRILDNGYYLVHIKSKSGRQVIDQKLTSYAVIAPLDSTEDPDYRFGVAGQFSKSMSTDVLPLLRKMGATVIRNDIEWSWVERTKGKYNFSRSDAFMKEFQHEGLAPVLTMAFGNKNYDHQKGVSAWAAAPHTSNEYKAYANYCASVLKHYGQQVKVMEIWNEYNGSFAKGMAATDRPEYYTQMLKVAYKRIKSIRPDVTVVGGAMVKIPLPYFEELCKAGALKYMDAIAVHPYRATPKGVEHEIAQLVEVTKKYNNGEPKPIYVTEIGTWRDHSKTRVEAACYLTQMYILLLTCAQVKNIDWFTACDYAQFRNQGLLHGVKDPMGKFTPVALYPAYANLIRRMNHTSFLNRKLSDQRTRIYEFKRKRESVYVCWSTVDSAGLNISATAPVKFYNLVGTEKELKPDHGLITLTIGKIPVYLVADKGIITAVNDEPRKDSVLANSIMDFSGEQGQDGWSYLYFKSNRKGTASYDPDKLLKMNFRASIGSWSYIWAGPVKYYNISRRGMSPSAIDGRQGWCVRRWTSDYSGKVHITGKVRNGDNGDGVVVKAFVNGRDLFSKPLPPDSNITINLILTLQKGSNMDFILTPGKGVDTSYDNVSFNVSILTD